MRFSRMTHLEHRRPMFALFLTGSGLAASAGLNAYLPILILALADRATSIIDLPTPYNWLSSNVGILVILLLLPLELIPDKIARVDYFSDLLHTALRPGAAALAFMAVAHQNDHIDLVWALILGLVIGGVVHWHKASSRAAISETTGGFGNPVVSLVEDLLAAILALVAIFLPWGVLVVIPLGFWYLHRMYTRMSTGTSRLMSPFQSIIDYRRSGAGKES